MVKIMNSILSSMRKLGWDDFFANNLSTAPNKNIARILSVQRGMFLVGNGISEWLCTPAGRLMHGDNGFLPVTGDWVITEQGTVRQVLPRKNMLCRGGSGSRGKSGSSIVQQPIGANIDTVFIVCGLDRDYNLRRIERYLTLVYSCSMNPVIILTKSDLCDYPEAVRQQTEKIAPAVPVIMTSIYEESEAYSLSDYLGTGRTAAMLGSSGAGKSSLANLLYGSGILKTGSVSESDGKGKHTTTSRELVIMPQGGVLMDNPGIREIVFYMGLEDFDAVFSDIGKIAELCRFSDCSHTREPGCAVREAVECGEISQKRLASYFKMKNEMSYAAEKRVKSADRIEKEHWKDVSVKIRRMKKYK